MIASEIERYKRIMQMNKWIDAENKVPTHNHLVLVLLENQVVSLAKYIPGSFWDNIRFKVNIDCWDVPDEWHQVTHWMELPTAQDLENNE